MLDPLQDLRVAIANASITERRLLDAAVRVGDRNAKLQAALKPFADWYLLQRTRQGDMLDTDNKQLCFCTRQGTDGITVQHLRAAADLLNKPYG
jgi:hypothetical protein